MRRLPLLASLVPLALLAACDAGRDPVGPRTPPASAAPAASIWGPKLDITNEGRIVFVQKAFGANFDIHTTMYHTTGGGKATAIPEPDDALDAAWDGPYKRVRYTLHVGVGGYAREIHSANVDGSDRRQLTSLAASTRHPRTNKEGTKLVFVSNQMGSDDLYLLDLTVPNATPERLTSDAGQERDPSWSPDGQLLFTGTRSGRADVYAMAPSARSAWTTILDCKAQGWDCAAPEWSPDGKGTLLFGATDAAGVRSVRAGRGVWGNPLVLVATGADRPTWSPEGTQILYQVQANKALVRRTYAYPSTLGAATELPEAQTAPLSWRWRY